MSKTHQSESILIGNAVLKSMLKDSTGDISAFSFRTPNGRELTINLNDFKDITLSPTENKKLKQNIYDTYLLGLENVPAFTPLLECVAESTSHISHSDANSKGMLSGYITRDGANGSNRNVLFFNIRGNPSPQDKLITFSSNGASYTAILEQRAINYLGEDHRWHKSDALELVTHEIAHGCKQLQDLSANGADAYRRDKLKGVVPEDEKKVKAFINKIILEPRGMPGRDLESDEIKKPVGDEQGIYIPLDKNGLEMLKNGPIPKELDQYSHPKIQKQQAEEDTQLNYSDHLKKLVTGVSLLSEVQRDFNTRYQQEIVLSRIVELLNEEREYKVGFQYDTFFIGEYDGYESIK